MTNRSKDIGTWAETKVVNYLRANGFPEADRRALHGNKDLGDILVCKGVIAEVKGGRAAEDASDEQLRRWCSETERERVNAKASHGFLVVKRRGFGVAKIGGWWVASNHGGMLCRFRLDDYTRFLNSLVDDKSLGGD